MTRREALRRAGAGVLAGSRYGFSQGRPIEVAGRPVEISVTPVSAETVRVTIYPIIDGQPAPAPSTGALVKDDWGQPAAKVRALGSSPQKVKCGDLLVSLSADPLTIRITGKGGRAVQELKADAQTGAITFPVGDAPLLGLGQGGPQFDKRGALDRMRSGQGGYQLATHGAKVPVQLAIGTGGWAMFIHYPMGSFDLTNKQAHFVPASPETALPFDVFVIGTNDPKAILAEYAKLTGLPEMPPLWSFGYQQSHRTQPPQEETLAEAKTVRDKKLPCDTMIYLGTGFCPNGWNKYNGEFDWNPNAFSDPKAAIQQLHELNFKMVLHIVVEGRKFFGRVSDPCTAPPLPTGRTPDGKWPPDRYVSCYWPAHKSLLELGVDGWWPDQGDGLDAPSRIARNRMYFEGHQMYRPNERVYALHRNGGAGMQRFAAFLWTGDCQSRWETLKNHVPIGINAGLSGIPWWGSDIGGFVPTQEYTGEMYIRWFQYAAFNPLFRSHGREWRLHTPWGWTAGKMIGFRETPSYNPDPAELRNERVEPICKKYLELRYQLMPYLYSAVKETCETGLPIIRALWLHYPDDPTAVARGDEYLYGRDLLVAPVVEKGATSRTVYLPNGGWYDFWTREKHEGGREITKQVDLQTIPLYVRAGAILPMGPIKQYTGQKVDGPLTVWVHPGADGVFSLYEDDGKTFNFKKGEFMRINMAWNDRQKRLTARLAPGSKMLGEPKRRIIVQVAGTSTKREVVFEGKPLNLKL